MLPYFGGVVSDYQYVIWLQCVLSVLRGDCFTYCRRKEKNASVKNSALVACAFIVLVFTYFLNFEDPLVLAGGCAIAIVYVDVTLGHIFWHIFSAYALYLWWFQFRLRPGDPVTSRAPNTSFVAVVFFIAFKNAVRRSFMTMPFPNTEVMDRVLFFWRTLYFCYMCILCDSCGAEYRTKLSE